MVKLGKKSGLLFLALYLKQCKVCLLQFYGGIPGEAGQLPVMVSLTKSGLPRIIPSHHRRMIMRRDDKADGLVKLYLSWFSLAKVILLSKKVSKETFEPITAVMRPNQEYLRLLKEIKDSFPSLARRYLPWIQDIPVHQGRFYYPFSEEGQPIADEARRSRSKGFFWQLFMDVFNNYEKLVHGTGQSLDQLNRMYPYGKFGFKSEGSGKVRMRFQTPSNRLSYALLMTGQWQS